MNDRTSLIDMTLITNQERERTSEKERERERERDPLHAAILISGASKTYAIIPSARDPEAKFIPELTPSMKD